MQYEERYRIVTTRNGVETYTELDKQTTEAEAVSAWDIAARTMGSGSIVTLVRVGTLVVASASKA